MGECHRGLLKEREFCSLTVELNCSCPTTCCLSLLYSMKLHSTVWGLEQPHVSALHRAPSSFQQLWYFKLAWPCNSSIHLFSSAYPLQPTRHHTAPEAEAEPCRAHLINISCCVLILFSTCSCHLTVITADLQWGLIKSYVHYSAFSKGSTKASKGI